MSQSRLDRVKPLALKARKAKEYDTLSQLLENQELLPTDVLEGKEDRLIELIVDDSTTAQSPTTQFATKLMRDYAKKIKRDSNKLLNHPVYAELFKCSQEVVTSKSDESIRQLALAWDRLGERKVAESVQTSTKTVNHADISVIINQRNQKKIITSFEHVRLWQNYGLSTHAFQQQIEVAARSENGAVLNRALQIIHFTQLMSYEEHRPRTSFQFLDYYKTSRFAGPILNNFANHGSLEQKIIATCMLNQEQKEQNPLKAGLEVLYPINPNLAPHIPTAKAKFKILAKNDDHQIRAYAQVRLAECCLTLAKEAKQVESSATAAESNSKSVSELNEAKKTYTAVIAEGYPQLDHYARLEIAKNLQEMDCQDILFDQYIAEVHLINPCPLLLDYFFNIFKEKSIDNICKSISIINENNEEVMDRLIDQLCSIISNCQTEQTINHIEKVLFNSPFQNHELDKKQCPYFCLNQKNRQKIFDTISKSKPIPAQYHQFAFVLFVRESKLTDKIDTFMFDIFDELVKANIISENNGWEIAFTFLTEQLKKTKHIYQNDQLNSKQHFIVRRLVKLAELNPKNAGLVYDVILEHYLVQDYKKALETAHYLPEEKKVETPLSRELAAAYAQEVKECAIKTLPDKLRALSDHSTQQAPEVSLTNYKKFITDVLNISNIDFTLKAYKNVLALQEKYKHHLKEKADLRAQFEELFALVFNAENVKKYPWELLDFVDKNKDQLEAYKPQILSLLAEKFKNNQKFRNYFGSPNYFDREKEAVVQSFREKGWFLDNFNRCTQKLPDIKTSDGEDTKDYFSSACECLTQLLLNQVDRIIDGSDEKEKKSIADVINTFLLNRDAPNFNLLKAIALRTIDKMNSKPNKSFADLRYLYEILASLFNKKIYITDDSRFSLYQRNLSTLIEMAQHKSISSDSSEDFNQIIHVLMEIKNIPMALLAQKTLNQACQIWCNKGWYNIAARAGYPLAIANLVVQRIDSIFFREGQNRGTFILCHALLMLIVNPEQTRQHFDLLHGEMHFIISLRKKAENYIQACSAQKWPLIQFFTKIKSKCEQGSVQPLFLLMNKDTLKIDDRTTWDPYEIDLGLKRIFDMDEASFKQFRFHVAGLKFQAQSLSQSRTEQKEENSMPIHTGLDFDPENAAAEHSTGPEIEVKSGEKDKKADHDRRPSISYLNPNPPAFNPDADEKKQEDVVILAGQEGVPSSPPAAKTVVAAAIAEPPVFTHSYPILDKDKEENKNQEGQSSECEVSAVPPVVSAAPAMITIVTQAPTKDESKSSPANIAVMPAQVDSQSITSPASALHITQISRSSPELPAVMPAQVDSQSITSPASALHIAQTSQSSPELPAVMPAKAGIQSDDAKRTDPLLKQSPSGALAKLSILGESKRTPILVQTSIVQQGEPPVFTESQQETVTITVEAHHTEGACNTKMKFTEPCEFYTVLNKLTAIVGTDLLLHSDAEFTISLIKSSGDRIEGAHIRSNIKEPVRYQALRNLAALIAPPSYVADDKQSVSQRMAHF